MELNEQSVAAHRELMVNPAAHGLDFKPLNELIATSTKVTAAHILFENYIDAIKKPLPKIFFYIVMEEIYGRHTGKDAEGNAGWHLKVIN